MAEELVVGTIVRVDQHPGARAPSLLLTVDLGPHGTQDLVLSTSGYDEDALEGAQILCRREAEGAVVVGAHSHGTGLVLLRPDREVEPGTIVS
jgi:tRNA-binding EMAP/Myf-like protein